ncbi:MULTISPECIES: hypothetical protein [Bacillus]|uniref:hypothetical protein n=1 Tax=Bacillus TaxID=1386 RepID=UPI002882336F|nr:hypothetical protein [Bacillus sp. AG4(2022)]MDT0159612.1 hypothetical protein [Bacillus sp. AG4(2022)]
MPGIKWHPYMTLISEAALASMLLCPVFMPSGDMLPVLYSFTLLAASAVLYFFLLNAGGSRGSLLFFAAVLPFIFIAGTLLGFSWFALLCFGVLVFWRTEAAYKDPEGSSDSNLFLLVFAGGFAVILAAVFLDRTWIGKLVWMVILQEAFIIVAGFFSRLAASGTSRKNKGLLIRDFVLAMLGVFAIGAAAVAAIPAVTGLFFSMMRGVAYLFGAAASPFFQWAEKRDWSVSLNEEPESQDQQLGESREQPLMEEQGQGFEMVLAAAAAASLIFIMYYLYKKRKKTSGNAMQDKEKSYITVEREPGSNGGMDRGKKRTEAPLDPVRREIYQLESYSDKLQLGRRQSESFPEWMNRIGLHVDPITSSIYEKVRYGEKLADAAEAAAFLKEIALLKKDLKRIHLHLVKEGELSSARFLGIFQKKQLKGRKS